MRWLVGLCACLLPVSALDNRISGVVTDGNRPVVGAVVRLQGTDLAARTNERGEFTLDLSGRITWPAARLTGWASGYYIAGPIVAQQGRTDVRITLRRHHETDESGYEWISAFSAAGAPANCQNCHSNPRTPQPLFPFDEWMLDAHGTSAQNRRFLSMYNGTDLDGTHSSPPTRYAYHKDYGRVPLPPDPAQPYYGPGFKLDFPQSAGNCAACHLPNAAVNAAYDTDPNAVQGVGKEGVGCDLCHKVWAVKLNPSTGLPYPNTPGVLSLEFRRPSAGHQLFLGPFDDVAPGDDSFSSLQNDSRMCAPCHFAQFWGVQVYNSFGEWLESPYSDPVKGRTCQDCHMPRRGAQFFARPEVGGLPRDPKTVFSHLMTGAADVALLRDTADLGTTARQDGSIIRATVSVTNARAGHHMPTDHPARNILLVVTARDAGGAVLPLLKGPLVPNWGGVGSDPADYAGKPGRGYAKILEELWTEMSPSAAYWNPTVLREDTRIPALGVDRSEYEFRAPAGGGPVTVEAQLIFRRAFKILQRQKSWDNPDILMGRASATVESGAGSLSPFTTVPATTFLAGPVAPASLVAGFGEALTTSPPSVLVEDSSGVRRAAQLLHVSDSQINYVVPAGTAVGPASVRVLQDGRAVAGGTISVEPVAPSLFAVADRRADVTSGQIHLHLYGTGFRARSSLDAFRVRLSGIAAGVVAAGPHPSSPGLDEVIVLLPTALAGSGEVQVLLTVDGRAASPVTIRIR